MKTVIFCYSRFGHGRVVAEALARELDAELRQVLSKLCGYPTMGFQTLLRSSPKIDPISTATTGFDLVVLGFPLWMGRPGAPMRTLLNQLDLKSRNVAYWVMTSGKRGQMGNLETGFEADCWLGAPASSAATASARPLRPRPTRRHSRSDSRRDC